MSNTNHIFFLVLQHVSKSICEDARQMQTGCVKRCWELLTDPFIKMESLVIVVEIQVLSQNKIFILTLAGLKFKECLLFSTKIYVLLKILLNRTDSKDFLTPVWAVFTLENSQMPIFPFLRYFKTNFHLN